MTESFDQEASIETVMLIRFLEAANAREILRWHKAEMEKAIELAKEAAQAELQRSEASAKEIA